MNFFYLGRLEQQKRQLIQFWEREKVIDRKSRNYRAGYQAGHRAGISEYKKKIKIEQPTSEQVKKMVDHSVKKYGETYKRLENKQ